MGLALLFSVIAVVVAVNASKPAARTVAEEVTPAVTEKVIADSRAQRAGDARRLLAEQNARLVSRGLPTVADPGNGASADEVVGAWITARVLGALPPTVTDELAAQVADGRTPRVIPSLAAPLPVGEPGDITVTVLPEDDPSGEASGGAPGPRQRDDSDSGPASPRPGTATRAPAAPPAARPPSARPAPQPAPAPRDRGLLEPCLLGSILC